MSAVIPALRAATRQAHEELESALEPETLCSSLERYTSFLGALHGFHAVSDAQLDGFLLPGVAPGPKRSELLAADLRGLGVDPSMLPTMPGLPDLSADGAPHGLIYVVEGSALGGVVLAKIVHRQLGLTAADGASFLVSGGAMPGRWGQVKAALEREVDGARLGAAERAAVGTFDALSQWMHARLGVAGPLR